MASASSIPYQQRLVVYVVWHPKFAAGAALAEWLYGRLSRDTASPLARGMGIPVLFRSASAPDHTVPAAIPVHHSRHTAVVLLVDEEMVADDLWTSYVEELWRTADASCGSHRIFPVKLSPNAFKLSRTIAEANFVRPLDSTGVNVLEGPIVAEEIRIRLSIAIIHELCRMITSKPRIAHDGSPPPLDLVKVTIFISHTKADGEPIARGIKRYIQEDSQLRTFFDANDIPYGENFRQVLEKVIESAALLIVQTDAYASSPWCLMELLEAKKHQRPVLVVNAVAAGEERAPVYAGNIPSRRHQPDQYAPIVERMLLEVLRREHFMQHFDDLAALFNIPSDVKALPYPPEPLTIADLRMAGVKSSTFVYPDPPLNRLELERLKVLGEDITVTTPLLLLATGGWSATANSLAPPPGGSTLDAPRPTNSPGPTPKLEDFVVGLSIGNGPDLPARGMGAEHLNNAVVGFALYLLASGAKLAYGGVPKLDQPDIDPQRLNFLEILLHLVVAYDRISGEMVKEGSKPPPPRLIGYMAAPFLSMAESAEFRAKWKWVFQVIKTSAGIDAPSDDAADADKAYFVARSLTAMRLASATDIDAQVLLGGKVFGSSGAYPGVVEECYLVLRAQKPVYLIGGFGGAARVVAEALRGGMPSALTRASQEQASPGYAELAATYDREAAAGRGDPLDFDGIVSLLRRTGVKGLADLNGLTEEENLRLFDTPHVPEMVYLVLKGLARVADCKAKKHRV